MPLIRILVIASLAHTALLAGCAAREPADPVAASDTVYLGDEPLYAVLERRGDGQWTLDEVTRDNTDPDDGFLLRLNDLAPAFDTRRAECEPRPYPENDRCNPLNPFREKDMGVVGKIVDTGITAGTGGKISSVSRSYTTAFDSLTFNAAVDEALALTGLGQDRARLIDGLARINDMVAAQNEAIADLAARMVRDYERDKRENIIFDLRVEGLNQYFSHDIEAADFVRVLSNTPDVTRKAVDRQAADILPCDADDCISALTGSLEQLEREHRDRLAELESRLRTETRSWRLDCSATSHAGYHFRLHCPDAVERHGSELSVVPVTMTILSRDFELLFPDYHETNESLSATVRDGQLVLENLTDDYLDVQSVSLYFNSHINTVTDEDGHLDLAPHQRKQNALAGFSSPRIDVESEFANMTPDKARRSGFSFGLAVKYSLRDRDQIETIYAVHDYDVHCAIADRLNSHRCVEQRASTP